MDLAWMVRLVIWAAISLVYGFIAPIASFLLTTPLAMVFAALDMALHRKSGHLIITEAFPIAWWAFGAVLAAAWLGLGIALFERRDWRTFPAILLGVLPAAIGFARCVAWARGMGFGDQVG